MANIGKYNTLTVLETSDHGLYLDGGKYDKILMPSRYVTPEMRVGSEVDCFVYNDSEDRLVATTETPHAQVGEFAYLEVVSIHPNAGAFLDWGLSKDLLLPYREQGDIHFTEGDGAIVAIYVDEYTNRIAATTRLHVHLPKEKPPYEVGDAVQVLIYGDSPLGFKAFIDKRYRGLLYHQETSDVLEPGDQFTGYIKKVHNDGKIDLRRDPSGYGRVNGVGEIILNKLIAAGGQLPFNDKSPPQDIRTTFDTSKKAFKQGLGLLYKQRRIQFTDTGIELVKPLRLPSALPDD